MRAVEKRLRLRVKGLEADLEEVRQDREKFRTYFSNKLKWFIEIHGKGNNASSAFMIEDMAKFLSKVKWFYWS